jgi:hypothetical protein
MLSAIETEVLLNNLCITLVFCLPPKAKSALIESPPAEINEFTNAVFLAEGLGPTTANRRLYRQVREMVLDRFLLWPSSLRSRIG